MIKYYISIYSAVGVSGSGFSFQIICPALVMLRLMEEFFHECKKNNRIKKKTR